MDKVNKFKCYRRQVKATLFQVSGLCIFLNFRYSSKCFEQIYGTQYGAAILVEFCVPPTWRPENSVNIWNLLWLSKRLIIWTEPASTYKSFPNTCASKRAKNRDRSGLSSTAITLWNCAGSQTKHAIELKSYKEIWVKFPLCPMRIKTCVALS